MQTQMFGTQEMLGMTGIPGPSVSLGNPACRNVPGHRVTLPGPASRLDLSHFLQHFSNAALHCPRGRREHFSCLQASHTHTKNCCQFLPSKAAVRSGDAGLRALVSQEQRGTCHFRAPASASCYYLLLT